VSRRSSGAPLNTFPPQLIPARFFAIIIAAPRSSRASS
jgi:hypothetical protein